MPYQLSGRFLPVAHKRYVHPILQHLCRFGGEDLKVGLQSIQILSVCDLHAGTLGLALVERPLPCAEEGRELEEYTFGGLDLGRGHERILVRQVCQHGLVIHLAQRLDYTVLDQKGLIAVVQITALVAETLLAAVIEPEIIFMICRGIFLGAGLGVAGDYLQCLLRRRAAVVVAYAVSLLVHTEIFRMLVIYRARQELGHGVLLKLNSYAFLGAAVDEIAVFGCLFCRLAAIYAEGIYMGAVGHGHPVEAVGSLDVIP